MALAPLLTQEGDLSLEGGGPRLASGVEAARGALFYRFSTFAGTSRDDKGEWHYNYTYGMPWRSAVLGRFFDEGDTRAVCADVATRTTGVQAVASYQVELSFLPDQRQINITINNLLPVAQSPGATVTITVPNGPTS
jgi:hypothetical protein